MIARVGRKHIGIEPRLRTYTQRLCAPTPRDDGNEWEGVAAGPIPRKAEKVRATSTPLHLCIPCAPDAHCNPTPLTPLRPYAPSPVRPCAHRPLPQRPYVPTPLRPHARTLLWPRAPTLPTPLRPCAPPPHTPYHPAALRPCALYATYALTPLHPKRNYSTRTPHM